MEAPFKAFDNPKDNLSNDIRCPQDIIYPTTVRYIKYRQQRGTFVLLTANNSPPKTRPDSMEIREFAGPNEGAQARAKLKQTIAGPSEEDKCMLPSRHSQAEAQEREQARDSGRLLFIEKDDPQEGL